MWKRSAWFWMWSEWAAAWKWLRAGGACLRHSQCCYKRIWRPCAGPEIDYTGWPVVMTIDKPTTYDNDVCAQSMDRTNGRVLGQIGSCTHAVFILFFWQAMHDQLTIEKSHEWWRKRFRNRIQEIFDFKRISIVIKKQQSKRARCLIEKHVITCSFNRTSSIGDEHWRVIKST